MIASWIGFSSGALRLPDDGHIPVQATAVPLGAHPSLGGSCLRRDQRDLDEDRYDSRSVDAGFDRMECGGGALSVAHVPDDGTEGSLTPRGACDRQIGRAHV